MSEQEKFAAQGEAHADLKKAKSTVATLKACLLSDAKWMRDTAGTIAELVRDPLDQKVEGTLHGFLAFRHCPVVGLL